MLEVRITRITYMCEHCKAQYEDPSQIGKYEGSDVCPNCVSELVNALELAEKLEKIMN